MDIKTKINAKILEIKQRYKEEVYQEIYDPGNLQVELKDGSSLSPHSHIVFENDIDELMELVEQL